MTAYPQSPQSSMDWAESKTLGVVSEITLMTPIKPGLVPGERRTYEQRLRYNLESLQKRESNDVPSFTRLITNIHYARWFILRPEQYLQYSQLTDIDYHDSAAIKDDSITTTPKPIDDFYDDQTEPSSHADKPRLISWLVFTSNFDGDLKSYARNVAELIGSDADRLWGNCYNYPGTSDFERWWLYARRHQIPTDVFYAAYPDLTVPRIQQLSAFKKKFDEFVARTRNRDGTSRQDIAAQFDEFLRDNLQYATHFPASGGVYDTNQAGRAQALRK